VKKPYTEVIRANIGDAHAMGQKPITFLRQVVAACAFPELIDSSGLPSDVKDHAKKILAGCKGGSSGSYSDSAGIEVIRQNVAKYITKRDGHPAKVENIILCAGASEGIRAMMKILNYKEDGRRPGMLIPIPQYPLYTASLAEYNMEASGYYLDESRNWALDEAELERSLAEAKKVSNPRGIVVINPGNPTGAVLTRENIEMIIKFACKNKLFIFADEVYQDNVYAPGAAFHSFKKVLTELGEPYCKHELVSFMSVSKGYMGECGYRGGYSEVINIDPDVKAMLLKSISAKLCPTVLGQAAMDCVVNPPVEGDPSYPQWLEERTHVLTTLKQRAKLVADTFNSLEGFTCNEVAGAMYAFPKIDIPEKAIKKAESLGQQADFFYAMRLLETTGICIVPGSGFGQKPGTYHFRTTILPQPELLKVMLDKLKNFQLDFMKEYA